MSKENTMSKLTLQKDLPDVNIRFVRVEDEMPKAWRECMIYVTYEEGDNSIFYGTHDGQKWIVAMPWDTCENGSGESCIALEVILGSVVAWAPFPGT
jgi:hypothetical protein